MDAPKRIVYLHASAELFGSDYVLLTLLKSLDRAHYDPYVILPFEGPLCAELKKANVAYEIHDLPVLRRQYFTPLGLLVFFGKLIRCLLFLTRLIKTKKVDAVHTNTAAVWVGGFAAAMTRRPHYWQIMELVDRPRLVSWMMRKIVGIFSTKVFCISNAVRDFFILANPGRAKKFQTVYHGVDRVIYDRAISGLVLRETLGLNEGDVLVTFAGRFNAWKGQDVLATAMPAVFQQVQNVHFLFIGSCFPGQEHFEDELKVQVEELVRRGCKATVLGFQSNLPEWLAATDIFVLPSTSPEPNATVTIAAMTMALPVVGTNIGGTPESVVDGETGLLTNPDDSGQLANAVVRLTRDVGLRRRMGEKGYQRAMQMFSIENYCQKVTAAYE
ncbi:MAG: glycosyltransferase [Kiritimatiellaeota bacterium]|nr:glycosyltransferase [Kiritimatiellota bacterium]